jgi:hypothetical protein
MLPGRDELGILDRSENRKLNEFLHDQLEKWGLNPFFESYQEVVQGLVKAIADFVPFGMLQGIMARWPQELPGEGWKKTNGICSIASFECIDLSLQTRAHAPGRPRSPTNSA